MLNFFLRLFIFFSSNLKTNKPIFETNNKWIALAMLQNFIWCCEAFLSIGYCCCFSGILKEKFAPNQITTVMIIASQIDSILEIMWELFYFFLIFTQFFRMIEAKSTEMNTNCNEQVCSTQIYCGILFNSSLLAKMCQSHRDKNVW